MWTCNKCGEELEDQFDSCWQCAGPAERIGLPIGDLIQESDRQIVSGIFLSLGVILATWLCFGPIAAFHHMFIFGITGYLVLNGESPSSYNHMWGEYGVRFLPELFFMSFALWLLFVYIVFKVVRFSCRLISRG